MITMPGIETVIAGRFADEGAMLRIQEERRRGSYIIE